jgi:hypothetical protein
MCCSFSTLASPPCAAGLAAGDPPKNQLNRPKRICPNERPSPDNGMDNPGPRRHRLKRVPVRPKVNGPRRNRKLMPPTRRLTSAVHLRLGGRYHSTNVNRRCRVVVRCRFHTRCRPLGIGRQREQRGRSALEIARSCTKT